MPHCHVSAMGVCNPQLKKVSLYKVPVPSFTLTLRALFSSRPHPHHTHGTRTLMSPFHTHTTHLSSAKFACRARRGKNPQIRSELWMAEYLPRRALQHSDLWTFENLVCNGGGWWMVSSKFNPIDGKGVFRPLHLGDVSSCSVE